MYYLSHHILAIDGVLDILPAKSVDINGNYRILVKKQSFRAARKSLIKSIPVWFEVHVPLDARPPEDAFPDLPGVAPIAEDGYSSGDDSYMNLSINTALSYDLSMSDTDATSSRGTASVFSRFGYPVEAIEDVPIDMQIPPPLTWAARARPRQSTIHGSNYPPADLQSQSDSSHLPPSEMTSDLAISRAEADEMRNQIKEVTQAFAQEKAELLKSFALEKAELIQTMKEEMANKSIREQVQQLIPSPPLANPESSTPVSSPSIQDQLQTFIDLQENRYITLTRTMMTSLMSNSY